MAAKGAKAGKAIVEFSLVDGKFRKGLQRASAKLKSFGRSLGGLGAKMAASSGAMLATFTAATKAFVAMGDQIALTSNKLGIDPEPLQKLGFAASQTGVEVGTLNTALQRQTRRLSEAAKGSGSAAGALKELGLNAQELNQLSPDEQFHRIADAMQRFPKSDQIRMAMAIWDTEGVNLVNTIEGGSDALNAFAAEFERLGLLVNDDDVKNASILGATYEVLSRQLKHFVFLIGAAVAEEFTAFLKITQNVIAVILKWVDKNRALLSMILKVTVVVGAIGAALMGLGLFFTIAGVAAAGLATAIGVVLGAVSFLLSPIGLLIASVAALGTWLITSTDIGRQFAQKFMEYFQQLRDFGMRTFGALADALKAGDMTAAAEILWATLGVIWEKGVGALESIWVGAQAIYTTTWTGVASFLFGIWGKLKIAWAEVVSFMRKFWGKMTTDIKSGFVKAQTFFTKMVLKAQKKAMEFATGEEFDISVELNQAEKRERELVAGFNEDQDDAIADAEAKRKEDREAIQQEQDVFKQDIDRTRDAAKEKREKRLTAAQERQAAATERWLKATETSEKKRQELEDSPTIDRAAMGAAEAGGRSSIGLSNARGIQSLMQGSTSIAERNLRANERTADNSEKQNRETIGV